MAQEEETYKIIMEPFSSTIQIIKFKIYKILHPTNQVTKYTSVWNSFSPCLELGASTFTATTSPVGIVAL